MIGSVDDAWVYKFELDKNGNSVLARPPFLSEDGNSYRNILQEVFDINAQFGVDLERQLDEFYIKRDALLKSPSDKAMKEFSKLGMELASQSAELKAIIWHELRQVSKQLNKEIPV